MRRITRPLRAGLLLAPLAAGCATTTSTPPVAPPAPGAPVEPMAPEAIAREVLHLDGTDRRLERLSRLDLVVGVSFTKLFVGLAEEERPPAEELDALKGRLGDAARAAFSGPRLVARSSEALLDDDGARRLPEVLAFLRSELARRMAFTRADAESPSGRRRMGSYLSRLPSQPRDPERRDLLLRLVEAQGEDDVLFRLSHDVTRRFFELAEPAFPGWTADAFRTFGQDAKKDADAFRAQVRKSLILEATYAYRKLSTEELEAAVQFWESDTGRWYARARLVAVTQALEEAYVVAGTRLKDPYAPTSAAAAAP